MGAKAWLAAGIAAAAAGGFLAWQRARHNRQLAQHAALILGCVERLDGFEEAWAAMRRADPKLPRLTLVTSAQRDAG